MPVFLHHKAACILCASAQQVYIHWLLGEDAWILDEPDYIVSCKARAHVFWLDTNTCIPVHVFFNSDTEYIMRGSSRVHCKTSSFSIQVFLLGRNTRVI